MSVQREVLGLGAEGGPGCAGLVNTGVMILRALSTVSLEQALLSSLVDPGVREAAPRQAAVCGANRRTSPCRGALSEGSHLHS